MPDFVTPYPVDKQRNWGPIYRANMQEIRDAIQALAAAGDTIGSGTTTQFLRGDRTWQSLNKSLVGLSNVDNTPDASKPVSTAQAAALTLKTDRAKVAFNMKDYATGDGVTNDGVAINTCLANAVAAGADVYWPPGVYRSTVNLPNLHAVRHHGPGAVLTGANFYLSPAAGQTNTLYVAPTGSDTNDGMSTRPFLTLQRAFDVLENYGPMLGGAWTISMAAGTYVGATLASTLRSQEPLIVKGPARGHPLVPTVTITSGYNVSSYGIRAIETGLALTVQDIHMVGYNGSSAAAGIVVSSTSFELSTVNVHFTDCYWGISTQSAPYDVKGGILTRCGFLGSTPNTTPRASRSGTGAGTRSLMLSRHSIGLQNAGDNANGPIFTGCQNAVFAQEGSTGHVDWATIQDCGTGLYVGASSRVNADGTLFKRNDRDIRILLNSNVYVTANTTFGTGADESGARVVATTGSQVVDDNRFFTDVLPVYGHSIRGLRTEFPNVSVTSTSSTIVYTSTLAAGMWRDVLSPLIPRKRVKLKVCGELFGTASNKRVTLRLGGAATQLLFTSTETGVFVAEGDVFFSDNAEQQIILHGYRHLGTGTRISRAVGSNAMTADTPLTLEAQVDTAGDSVSVYSIDVSWG